MAESESEPIRRAREALSQPVVDFANPVDGWKLVVQCANPCPEQSRLVSDLLPCLPPGLSWAKVVLDIRCSRCCELANTVALSGLRKPLKARGVLMLVQRNKGAWRYQS